MKNLLAMCAVCAIIFSVIAALTAGVHYLLGLDLWTCFATVILTLGFGNDWYSKRKVNSFVCLVMLWVWLIAHVSGVLTLLSDFGRVAFLCLLIVIAVMVNEFAKRLKHQAAQNDSTRVE